MADGTRRGASYTPAPGRRTPTPAPASTPTPTSVPQPIAAAGRGQQPKVPRPARIERPPLTPEQSVRRYISAKETSVLTTVMLVLGGLLTVVIIGFTIWLFNGNQLFDIPPRRVGTTPMADDDIRRDFVITNTYFAPLSDADPADKRVLVITVVTSGVQLSQARKTEVVRFVGGQLATLAGARTIVNYHFHRAERHADWLKHGGHARIDFKDDVRALSHYARISFAVKPAE